MNKNSISTTRYDFLQGTIALKNELEGGFLILAERLKKIRDERVWEGSYENFEDFLREIDISKSAASKLIGVFEKFVLMGGIKPEELAVRGWTNLSIFLPLIHSKEDAQEIYDKVSLLNRTDAIRTYQEMKSGVEMAHCSHTNSYTIKVCRDCGIRLQEFPE